MLVELRPCHRCSWHRLLAWLEKSFLIQRIVGRNILEQVIHIVFVDFHGELLIWKVGRLIVTLLVSMRVFVCLTVEINGRLRETIQEWSVIERYFQIRLCPCRIVLCLYLFLHLLLIGHILLLSIRRSCRRIALEHGFKHARDCSLILFVASWRLWLLKHTCALLHWLCGGLVRFLRLLFLVILVCSFRFWFYWRNESLPNILLLIFVLDWILGITFE